MREDFSPSSARRRVWIS